MSNSSLYGPTGNVTVSAKNLTTLYNSSPSSIVTTEVVTDSNFTTLYAKNSAQINVAKGYGNANVEAFLNEGGDGGNSVQNIQLHGNITVGQQSFLGQVSNVHIEGGTLNYVLATDGSGGLSWVPNQPDTSITDYIHFDVTITGTGQTFTSSLISQYLTVNKMSVMKNGVNIEPTYYTLSAPDTVQVNILLNSGDTIDILPSGHGLDVGGNITEIQYNGGNILSGNSSFTFNQPTSTLTVGNIVTGNLNLTNLTVSGQTHLGPVSNVFIGGGSNGYVLHTNGSNVLSWTNEIEHSNISNISLDSYHVAGANVTGVVANANSASFANIANTAISVDAANIVGIVPTANFAFYANTSNTSITVTGNNQPNITSIGALTGLTATSIITSSISTATNGNLSIQPNGTGIIDIGGKVFQNPKFKQFSETVVNGGTVNGTLTPNLSSGTIFNYILDGDITINSFANVTAGSSTTLVITQDSTGGHVLSSTMKFAGGANVLSTGPGVTDIIIVFYNGVNYYASLIQGFI